jgi:hypothetical protein
VSRANAVGLRMATSGLTVASMTGLTALDSTTKCAYAAYVRIPVSALGTGDIMYHADAAAPGNGTLFRTATTDAMQVSTFNGSSITQLAAPRALGMTRTFRIDQYAHYFAVVDAVAGVCRWYVNGRYIGNSTTAAVAWTAAGTRTTGIGMLTGTFSYCDVLDLRHWAQNDADICIASPLAIARLAMLGRPAGESIRLLNHGPNGIDASGNGRHVTWVGASNTTVGAVDGPKNTLERLTSRRRRRVGFVRAANNAPTANISAPATGASTASGVSVSFAGTGSDTEDGTLTGASLVWTSSRDGTIGTGTAFSTSALSVGTHTITLTATDSLGATGTASITHIVTGSAVPCALFLLCG